MTSADATRPDTTTAEDDSGHRHLGAALALICTAQLMVVLDGTIANIALPYIQADLDFSEAALPWIITAYALTFGGFLLLGGRVGDLFGRRRAFMVGLLLFAFASLLGGFAENEAMLLCSRALQGLGAAFASPNALALITTTFEPGPKRSRAFAVYAMMSGLGAAIGLLLGGWLTGWTHVLGFEIEGWRLTFLINVPIGLAAAWLAPRVLAESDTHAGRLDVPGAITATAGLLSLVYGITRAGEESHGWDDTWTLVALGAGVALLLAFALIERRAAAPLLPGRILASRDRLASYVVMMFVPAAMFTTFFFMTLIFQTVMGKSPMETGLMFLPFSITMIVAAMVTSRLVQKVNPGILSGIGALIASSALLLMSRFSYDASPASLGVDLDYWTDFFPSTVLMPLGLSMVFIPMTMSVVHKVSPADSGIASGVLNTMQQVGGALGLATLSTIALTARNSKAAEILSTGQVDPNDPRVAAVSFIHGASTGLVAGAVMLAIGAVVAFSFNRIKHAELGGRGPAPAAH